MLPDLPLTLAEPATPPSRPLASYLLAALLSAALFSLPFTAVHFPPITDLPQQVAQIRLLSEVFSEESPYRLNLAAPGWLSYSLFGLSWLVVGPESAGRAAYLVLGLLWLVSLAVVVRARGRDPSLIPLAGIFFFSHPLYWGFFSFLFGASLFLLWTIFERRLRIASGGALEVLALTAGSVLLYSSHLFWFVAGSLWLVAATLSTPLSERRRWLRGASLIPAAALAAFWVPRLAQSGFASETAWRFAPWARLAPGEWIDRLFGALHGPVEPVLLVAVVTWLAIGLWHRRGQIRNAVDPTLLLLGCLMLAASLLLPDRYQNTLRFAGRWAPIGATLVALALPPPRIRSKLRWLVALTLLATLTVTTTAVWKRFEQLELAGLQQSLATLPDEPRLLGLDFFRLSQFVKTQPFFQNHAYGQVLKGGTLGFSFASFPASPVVFTQWQNPPWAPGLEWLPYEIFEQMDDVRFFDYVLVHADPAGHAFFAQQPILKPESEAARWRLYRVVEGAWPAAHPRDPTAGE